MGYHAPRAEDVYRYIFRLDRYSWSGLSDGFSWSILFLNDNSLVCREFLAQYGAELCYRTADRIRFVFFSGLEDYEFQGAAYAANRHGSFLSRIIQAAARLGTRRRSYDFERGDWDAFRPKALCPLDSQEHISRQIDHQVERYSAMPGSEEALRLAQRLGLGRFVPCFLLFSDIGAPAVSLFPIAYRTHREVFERLRIWIDSYYEINHATLTRWASIENSIEQAVSKYRMSIGKVNRWREERKTQWEALQAVTRYLNQVANGPPDIALLEKIGRDYSIPREVRSLAAPFLEWLRVSKEKQEDARVVREWHGRVLAADTSLSLHGVLWNFNQRNAKRLPESARVLLEEALNSLSPPELPPSPESELAAWWRSESGRLPSRKKYDKYRNAWAHYSQKKHGTSAIGNVAKILREEFEAVQQALLAQWASQAAEDSAGAVIRRLAAHLEIAPQDADWDECVSGYRQHLTDYFNNLKKNAPAWVLNLAAGASPTLTWGDCMPGGEQRQEWSYRESLNKLPRLHEQLQRSHSEWSARLREIEEQHREQQKQSLNKLTAKVEEWLSAISLLEAEQQSVWLALTTSLSRARQDLEEMTFKNASDAFRASYPGDRVSQGETADLLRLLDEYDRAVTSIRLPFKEDEEVLRVGLDTSLLKASGIADSEVDAPFVGRKSRELLSAVEEAERAAREWDVLRQEVSVWSPPGKLVGALKAILSPGRMAEVQPALAAGSPETVVAALTDRGRIISLLDVLSVQELVALERHVVGETPSGGGTPAITKRELYDSILVAIGLLPRQVGAGTVDAEPIAADKIETLSDKVRRGLFDVFMAHNAQDKGSVLRLSHELRRKGIYPWVDVEQIPPGRWFQDVIQSAVRTVKAAAIVIGNSGLGRWQALELRVFMSRCVEHGIPLIPVLLPGVAVIPNNLEFLRELNQVKFGKDVTEEEGLSRLIWGITGEKI